MEKSNYIMRLQPIKSWMSDLIEEGYIFSLIAYKENKMFEKNMMSTFTDLNTIDGLKEIIDGHMVYSGELTQEELSDYLSDLGFIIEIKKT